MKTTFSILIGPGLIVNRARAAQLFDELSAGVAKELITKRPPANAHE
jgi:hypothetical protein